jgi:hypothetical protein
MSKLVKTILALFIFMVGFWVLGGIAKGFNESHHLQMALDQCGSEENIARVDSDGFECRKN